MGEASGEGFLSTVRRAWSNFVSGEAFYLSGQVRERLDVLRSLKTQYGGLMAELLSYSDNKPGEPPNDRQLLFVRVPVETMVDGKAVRTYYAYTDRDTVAKFSFVVGVDDKAEEELTLQMTNAASNKQSGGYGDRAYDTSKDWRVPAASWSKRSSADGQSFLAALDNSFAALESQAPQEKATPINPEFFRQTRPKLEALTSIR